MISAIYEWRAERPRYILLVEDNPDVSRACQQILTLRGHKVAIAVDGESAIEIAATMHPDVVLCDLNLPGMDGFAVVKALRSNPATRQIAIGMLTAQYEERERALHCGCDEFFEKPAPLTELLDFVETWNSKTEASL